MSTESDSVCLQVLSGRIPAHLAIRLEWHGSAKSTFDYLVNAHDLLQLHPDDVFWQQRLPGANKQNVASGCSLYLAKCTSLVDSVCIYKVGIARHVNSRMQEHQRNPMVRWHQPVVAECSTRKMASAAETAILAAAASAGMWLGGEFIAGCRTSKKLAITRNSVRKDRRFRIRTVAEL